MPGNPKTFDVVIAGGGMTGGTLALALAQAGLGVALCDGQPLKARLEPTFDGRASAIAAASFRQFRALGIAGELEKVAQPIRTILVTDGPSPGASAPAPAPVFLRFVADDLGHETPGEPMGWMVENRHIRAALAKAIKAGGITTFAPAFVEEVEHDAKEARVRLRDGKVLVAPLVVGAEGRRSTVRTAAGIDTYGWEYKQSGVVATVALERDHEGVAHEYFLPGGPLAILPLTGQRASLVWTEEKSRARALIDASPEAFEAHLHRRFGAFLGRPRVVGERMGFPLSLQMAERMTGPRIALIGDAAHAIHPVAGQGLNLGLKDAAALAEVIVEARRLGEDFGSELVLDRYARWRRFDAAALAAATDVFTRLFSNDDPVARLVRGAGIALVNRLAPARRLFVREAAGLLGDTPKLLRGEPL
jgi:2-octaprenyl-6-methoxyphenol hydroxylase